MIERLNLYDLLASLIPGATLVAVVAVLFPAIHVPFDATELPSEFSVIALLAGFMLAGQLVQTLGSRIRSRPRLSRGMGIDRRKRS